MMKASRVRHLSALISATAMGVLLGGFGGCGGDDTGSSGSTNKPSSTGAALTGDPCTLDKECATGFCLTNSSFKSLTDGKETNIPGGYCSKVGCKSNDECKGTGYCFNLAQYPEVAVQVGVCLKTCTENTDCRAGYVCNDGSGPNIPPLPKKACMSDEWMCLLDIPRPICPNVGTDAGAEGGTDASSD